MKQVALHSIDFTHNDRHDKSAPYSEWEFDIPYRADQSIEGSGRPLIEILIDFERISLKAAMAWCDDVGSDIDTDHEYFLRVERWFRRELKDDLELRRSVERKCQDDYLR
jgi:hypothetical protein